VTSDNPRTEDPEAIIAEIVAGMPAGRAIWITDRRTAIEQALSLASPGDMVLLAGKGHEDYQIVGTEKRPFDERIVVRELLGAAGREVSR
jgi:UDP-N-acetylmuramoyl-L-alanyl-D-glutamate--2,6-diaminopimelate ligase